VVGITITFDWLRSRSRRPGRRRQRASFAGDDDYLSSSTSRPFTITREQTTTTYTGPAVVLKTFIG